MAARRLSTTAREWLVVPLLLSAALAGCAPGVTPDELPPIPDIDVSGYIDATSSQLNELRGAVERDPLDASAWAWLGYVQLALGQTNIAGESLRKAVRADVENPDARRFYGRWLSAYAEPRFAIRELSMLLRVTAADNPQLLARLAALQADAGDRRAALTSIAKGIEIAGVLRNVEARTQLRKLQRDIESDPKPPMAR